MNQNDYRMGWPAALLHTEPDARPIHVTPPRTPRATGDAFEAEDWTHVARHAVAESINGAAQADKPAQHGAASGSVDEPVAAPPLPDGWIEHDGGCCPVPPGTPVEVRLRKGNVHKGRALIDCPLTESQWIAEPPGMDRDYMRVLDITHYRIVSKA